MRLHGSSRISDWEGRGVADLCLRSFLCKKNGVTVVWGGEGPARSYGDERRGW